MRFHHPFLSYNSCSTAIVCILFNFIIILHPFYLSLGCGTGCVLSVEPSVLHKLLLLWLLNFSKVNILSFLL